MQCSALKCTAMHCNALQCTAMHCNALQCTAMQCTAMHCNAMQCTALHCNALPCNAMQCDFVRQGARRSALRLRPHRADRRAARGHAARHAARVVAVDAARGDAARRADAVGHLDPRPARRGADGERAERWPCGASNVPGGWTLSSPRSSHVTTVRALFARARARSPDPPFLPPDEWTPSSDVWSLGIFGWELWS